MEESLEKQVEQALAEARTVLPGIQALFGFQLVAVFNQTFAQKLDRGEQVAHLTALGLTAVATGLLMTPAAYHRQVEPGRVSQRLVRVSSRCLSVGMLPLLFSISIDFYVIARLIVGDRRIAAALAVIVASSFTSLWFVFPAVMRKRHRA